MTGKVVLCSDLMEDGEAQMRIDRYPITAWKRNEKLSPKSRNPAALDEPDQR
jgi:hypothetical protein